MEGKTNNLGNTISHGILAVLTLATFFIYIANVSAAYYQDMNAGVLIMMLLALAAAVGILLLSRSTVNGAMAIISDVLRIAIPVLLIASGAIFIGMRIESFGYIFGSNLELGNEAALSAGTQAVTGIVLFVVNWLVAVVLSFFRFGKASK